MSRIIIAGTETSDIGTALAERGPSVTHVPAPVTDGALAEAGLGEADLFVLTAQEEATAIPIVREQRPDITIVVYNEAGVPDFASHLADLIIDPAAIEQPVVIEELLDRID